MRQVNRLLIIVVFYFVSIGLDTSDRLRLGTSFIVQRLGELNVKVFL